MKRPVSKQSPLDLQDLQRSVGGVTVGILDGPTFRRIRLRNDDGSQRTIIVNHLSSGAATIRDQNGTGSVSFANPNAVVMSY